MVKSAVFFTVFQHLIFTIPAGKNMDEKMALIFENGQLFFQSTTTLGILADYC